jgi:hypothetical protein
LLENAKQSYCHHVLPSCELQMAPCVILLGGHNS